VNLELCAICARGIAAEEPSGVYVSSKGSRTVCARCASRAEKIGWRPADASAAAPPVERASDRGGRLGGLFRRRSASERPPAPTAPEPGPAPRPSPDPAAPGARVERLEPTPTQASPFERAVERFNESDAGYTMEGLVRTLGRPWVSVGASAGSPSEVRITVAWELSWYQWGVDLEDEQRPVFDIDKGSEIDQLDSPARQWNAAVLDGGRIVLAPAAPGRGEDRQVGRRAG
jgi:hypothetical protein